MPSQIEQVKTEINKISRDLNTLATNLNSINSMIDKYSQAVTKYIGKTSNGEDGAINNYLFQAKQNIQKAIPQLQAASTKGSEWARKV